MGIFRTHREAAAANNRVIGRFFLVMCVCVLGFGVVVAGRYLLGWW